MLRKLGTLTPLYLRHYLYWSGQVQVRYVVSTSYYLLPTTYYRLPTTDYRLPTTGKALLGRRALSCQEQRRLNACRKEHAYNAYREEHLSERSIVPLNSSGNWLRHHHSETRQIPSGQTDRASCIADSKAAERNKSQKLTL